ncbi:hypothetical protein B0T17DRAFT_545521 [Bombardia bombarda]|uniref:Nephrocystin 3-like N-terminal domain-containing protein n=1 Tax=Bombardia bombarda TaxID=252184 RepID=A0AA39U2Z8_9PEZI|nr:hypothetical protein B0T17DRAFT_545521 [Bombardia bombarda]
MCFSVLPFEQLDFMSASTKGSGQWLTKSTEFQTWLGQRHQTLFCPGIPGAGKTMLTANVIDFLQTKFSNQDDVRIAFLYCNY